MVLTLAPSLALTLALIPAVLTKLNLALSLGPNRSIAIHYPQTNTSIVLISYLSTSLFYSYLEVLPVEEGHIREGHFAAGVNGIVSIMVYAPCTGPSSGSSPSAGSRRMLTFDEV